MSNLIALSLLMVLGVLLGGCGGAAENADGSQPAADAGSGHDRSDPGGADAGISDARADDAAAHDAADVSTDVEPVDTETSDAGTGSDTSDLSDAADGGKPDDAGGTDAGPADAGWQDTGGVDASTGDTGAGDAGAADAGIGDTGGTFDEDPVVFVHGWYSFAKDWDDFIAYFRGLGYPDDHLAAIQFSNITGSSIANARDELPPFVDAVLAKTGHARVDVVGHSMAGLSVRLYILKYGGKDKVRDVFLLAPTNHGGTEACAVTYLGEGAKEMCPAYATQDESVNMVQWDLNGDPDTDDADETPFCVAHGTGDLFYWTVRDGKDLFANPHDTACLNQRSRGDCSDPLNLDPGYDLGHFGLLHDARIFDIAAQKLRLHNDARPR